LLVHGNGDRRVEILHGWRMRDALENAGVRYRYIEQEGGDHYLSRQSYRTAFFEEMEAFLAEHLKIDSHAGSPRETLPAVRSVPAKS